MDQPTQQLPPPPPPGPPTPGSGRRNTALLVAAAIIVAGIGGGVVGAVLVSRRGQDVQPSPSPTSVQPTPSPVPSASPSPSPTTTIPTVPALSTRTFIMPSRNIGCGFYFQILRCDILSGLNPTPTGECPLDWTGLSLEAEGGAGSQCAGDTVFDPEAPTLDYGRTWSRADITCVSAETGLRCSNSAEHGFFLSRARWETF